MLEHDQLISDVLTDPQVTQRTNSCRTMGKLLIGDITRSESLRFRSRFHSARDALHAMDKYGVMQLVVMDDGYVYVYGIVTRQDIIKAVQEFPYATDSSRPTDQT